jgi:hypothetical protein
MIVAFACRFGVLFLVALGRHNRIGVSAITEPDISLTYVVDQEVGRSA